MVCIGKVEGVQSAGSQGKDVVVKIESTNKEEYNDLTWKFRLTYKEAQNMRIDYEINGKSAFKRWH